MARMGCRTCGYVTRDRKPYSRGWSAPCPKCGAHDFAVFKSGSPAAAGYQWSEAEGWHRA
jgi:hypothetical protein